MYTLFSFIWMLVTFACSQVDFGETENSKMVKVFVYGSLKRGEPNHHLLENRGDAAIFENSSKTRDSYPLVIASKNNIPYMLDTPGKGMIVHGELYNVDKVTLGQLDVLEGHPNYYNRSKIQLLKNGTETEAWAYLLQNYKPFMDTLPYLESYSSKGSHGLPFVNREDRIPGDINSFTEVKIHPEDIIAPNSSATFDGGSPVEKRHIVFIYGTLKRAEENHREITNKSNGRAELLALGNTVDKFPLVIASRYNIPFLLDHQGVGKQVDGEIYWVDNKMLNNLDAFEDYSVLYTRKVVNVAKKNTGEKFMAWIYLLADFKTELLQNALLTSYSTGEPNGIPYEEPKELNEEEFHALLTEVKTNPSLPT